MAKITVLALECFKGPPLAEQLPKAEVITWPDPGWAPAEARLNAMLKPAIFTLARRQKTWIRQALAQGRRWDIAHQLLPAAPRYPTALRHFDIPYVIGPVGGAIETPFAFRKECGSAPIFTRLRNLDRLRFRHDPWLRDSYAKAARVLGVAPYMKSVLSDLPIKRFQPFLALGIDALAPRTQRSGRAGALKILHVGRAVRTKGLRDVVRALARLRDWPEVRLISVGDGEDLSQCRDEADALGISEKISFLGHLPRSDIEALYRDCDVFVFPSFRESMGGVLYEAMRWGLPVITTTVGGPGWIIDDTCGLRVDAVTPDQLARDIAEAIRTMASDPVKRAKLGAGARARVERQGLWSHRANDMLSIYEDILSASLREVA
jgi:glycosyltransferase involved in cell wall biosynthesis